MSVGGEAAEPYRTVRLGNRHFACELLNTGLPADPLNHPASSSSSPESGAKFTPSGRAGVLSVLTERSPDSSALTQIAHVFRFEDTVRPSSKLAIQELAAANLKVCMLTGDNTASAHDIASQIGGGYIKEIHAALSPEGKLLMIERLKRETTGKVIFAGDGLNGKRGAVSNRLVKVGNFTFRVPILPSLCRACIYETQMLLAWPLHMWALQSPRLPTTRAPPLRTSCLWAGTRAFLRSRSCSPLLAGTAI